MSRDKDGLTRYYENIPYGNKSLAWEVHGPEVKAAVNKQVKTLVTMSDAAAKQGENEVAEALKSGIYYIQKQGENLKSIKEEHSQNVELGSNWCTTYGWDDNFFTEKGQVYFDENMKVILSAFNPITGEIEDKSIEDVTKDWESIGDWMQTLSTAKQDLIKAKSDINTAPPFDIDFFTTNLIKNNWKSMIADSDPTLDPNGPSNGYRLQQILLEEADVNGNLPADYNLDRESFNPEFDTRLHNAIAGELKRTFDPNWQSENEKEEAKQLMSRINV